MSTQFAVAPTASERDPIADARALVAMAVNLGARSRNAHRLGQVTDRKASLYVNTLVRHAARLLQSTDTHNIPVLHATGRGPGGNAVHFVIRHDTLDGPPVAQRFVTVGSDARLRCCVVSAVDGSRIWADYDVSSAPDDLTLRVVLDALSELINRLEQAVTQLEIKQITREAQLEADMANAQAKLSGMTAEGGGPKRHATSEEPVRPWTRHVAGAGVKQTVDGRVAAEEVRVEVVGEVTEAAAVEAREEVPVVAAVEAPAEAPVAVSEEVPVAAAVEVRVEADVEESEGETARSEDEGASTVAEARPRRGFKLSRLGNAI